ncbi:MAG: GIY-YIG nuclease family protein [Candidatus Omnitrophica bacterium]|nr:GIY-YIG nuclease family protein [Candidatus Omnitrophota bacterium]
MTDKKNWYDDWGWIYLLKCGEHYKIGMTKRTPDERVSEYSPKLPEEPELIMSYKCLRYREEERKWHKLLAPLHTNGEWFRLDTYHLHCFFARAYQQKGEHKTVMSWETKRRSDGLFHESNRRYIYFFRWLDYMPQDHYWLKDEESAFDYSWGLGRLYHEDIPYANISRFFGDMHIHCDPQKELKEPKRW